MPVSRFHSALPTRLSREPCGARGRRRGGAGRGRGGARVGGAGDGRRAVPQLGQMLVQVAELVQGEVAQRPLPPAPGVRHVVPCLPPHGVDLALEPARLRCQGVDRTAPRRLAG